MSDANGAVGEPPRAIPGDDIFDITIIGAGPTGQFAAFYAGLRGARTQIIDALEEPGGALTAIYPEKYIYDVIGFPRVLAKDFVAHCDIQARQAEPTIRLSEQVRELDVLPDGLIRLGTSKGERWSRTVIVCAGVGAFEPKRLAAPGLRELEGKGVHYFAKRVEDFRDKHVVIVGGGDSAVDWAVTLEPVAAQVTLIHRSKFRAHEATVRQLEESTVDLNYPGCEITAVDVGEDGQLAAITFKTTAGDERTIPADDLIVAIGFVADLGPMKSWGFELQRNQIAVDQTTMETGLPGVYAAGDVVTYAAKFKLIVTGAAEAVTAVNHAVTYYDPNARLDAGHSTNIMEKREKAEATAGADD
ncbi:MAG: NAD(P)/FAD-dependent oxidoreductase [Chloroflexota bacterium]|nr:NAD(P)/FAD-dependent oxidoreductase [Chloroflexia bacterium]MDQ3226190.1 NAD(P)/FAD-dependent oxidoreductase [Chloroflexota bacterium]